MFLFRRVYVHVLISVLSQPLVCICFPISTCHLQTLYNDTKEDEMVSSLGDFITNSLAGVLLLY